MRYQFLIHFWRIKWQVNFFVDLVVAILVFIPSLRINAKRSINIISATPVDSQLTRALATGAVASAEALQAETQARGQARAVAIAAEAEAARTKIAAKGEAEAEVILAKGAAEAEKIKAEGS